MPGDVAGVVEDARDDNLIPVQPIKDAMAAIDDTANVRAIAGPRFPKAGKDTQTVERFTDATLIGGGSVISELFHPEGVDFREIGPGSLAKPYIRHVARGVLR